MAEREATDADALEIAREITGYVTSDHFGDTEDFIKERFTGPIYKDLKVTAATASPVSVTFSLKIPLTFANPTGGLHGGAAASIIDDLSSHTVSVWAGLLQRYHPDDERALTWIMSGTSRSINVSYLRPVPVGSTVEVYNEVQSVGKTMAFARTVIRDSSSGKIMVSGEHHKVAVKPML